MKITVVVHEAEEGGYWAEVPALPGCFTQGETIDEIKANAREAVQGCLDVIRERTSIVPGPHDKSVQLLEIAV